MTPTAHQSSEMAALAAAAPSHPLVQSTATEVFREYGRFVFRVLRRLGVHDADVDDVFQEVFVVVHRKLPELAPSGSLRAWVYGICVRRAANYRKRRWARREHTTEEEVEHPDVEQFTPVEAIDAGKAREVLENILRSLPDQKREVFVLHVIEELPMQEVADALGCPLHTAYSRFYAARKLVEDGIRRARAQMSRT
ncbi:MAG: polymerase sigma factor RpoE [Labilithrix sp.]|nr:polymerase sigma factor RpoE [Labilithrix sp.]